MTSFEKNIAMAAGLGLAAGICIGAALTAGNFPLPIFAFFALLAAAPLGAGIAIAVALSFAGRFPFAPALIKFLIVGAVSTFLELAVLNVLFAITGVTAGVLFSVFKALTYILGMTNSYVFNKYWSFGAQGTNRYAEIGKFIAVNIMGLIINVGTASLIVNGIGAPSGISGAAWANFAAIVAVFVVLVWNFLNYKFFVFRTEEKSSLNA